MGQVFTMIKTDRYTTASGLRTRKVEEERCSSKTALTTMVSGRETRCMGLVYSSQTQETDTKVILAMGLKVDLAHNNI